MARLFALAKIEEEMGRLSVEEGFLKQALREVAPASVAQFLKDEGTVDDLLKYGQSSRKIVYGGEYGFKSARQVKNAFRALLRAWQGAVEITFCAEVHRIEVSIKIP